MRGTPSTLAQNDVERANGCAKFTAARDSNLRVEAGNAIEAHGAMAISASPKARTTAAVRASASDCVIEGGRGFASLAEQTEAT
jgi:hypothetical protein